MKSKRTQKRNRPAALRSNRWLGGTIVANLKMRGSTINVWQMQRNILLAVRDAVEDAAKTSFIGKGKVETKWTVTLQ